MNTRRTLRTGTLLPLLLILAFPGVAQVDDCNFSYTLTTGCSEDGTGWATVSKINSKAGPFSIHWNGAEMAGNSTITGLSDGEFFVTVFDIGQCGVVQTFTISCGDEEESSCVWRTQTQGGWGSNAHGNNPGAYRDTHFAAAFPNGLEIGCTNKLRLTTSAAVAAFLPSGSTARVLEPGTLVDPARSYRNVLAGQLVALTLSVGFDSNDPAFGMSNGMLANAEILSGAFQGWSVQMLMDEANNFLGGCGSSYTASQLNSGLSMINENFVDGTTNNGHLGCGSTKNSPAAQQFADAMHVYPNPTVDLLTVRLPSHVAGQHTLTLLDASGRKVFPNTTTALHEDEQRVLQMDLKALPNGNYILVLEGGALRLTRQVVISR